MPASESALIGRAHENFPAFLRQRERAKEMDPWAFGQQKRDELFIPRGQQASPEYHDLGERSPNPWGMLIITSVVQTIFLDGVRMPGAKENLTSWRVWQENDFDEKQIALYRASMSHGAAFVEVDHAKNRLTGDKSVLWKPRSAKRVACFWDEDDTEWPLFAIDGRPTMVDQGGGEDPVDGWQVQLIDDDGYHHMVVKDSTGIELKDWEFVKTVPHNFGVPPVVEYPNLTDVDGNSMSELEPLLPLLRRIDQDTFDRLIVQRFGAWKVRYITGLVRPQGMSEEKYQAALRDLKVNDFLVADSDKTKFGQLDEMDLTKLISAADHDLRTLSAVSQTPPHHMLGLSSNLQAESLAAAEAGLQRKSFDRKTVFGTRHERLMRLTAKGLGNKAEMRAFDMQVRWRDMESRSLSQAADALGKLATQVGVPQQMLFEMIPHWTDSDVKRATELVKSGAVDKLMAEMEAKLRAEQDKNIDQPGPVGAGGLTVAGPEVGLLERLDSAQRTAQAANAAAVALAVMRLWQQDVNPKDISGSGYVWLGHVLAAILRGRERSALLAGTYYQQTREIMLPDDSSAFELPPIPGMNDQQVRRSMTYTGLVNAAQGLAKLPPEHVPTDEELDEARERWEIAEKRRAQREQDEMDKAMAAASAAAFRHVQNGGRDMVDAAVAADQRALGYVRVIRPGACWFCAMLASRGAVYKDDSFDMSDPRFTGPGEHKVHDSCGCALRAVFTRDHDEWPQAAQDMHGLWGETGGAKEFRVAYEELYL